MKDIDHCLLEVQDKGIRVSAEFGLLLKKVRGNQNMSLREVEQRSGVSASYLSRLERGERRSPGLTVVFKLAHALNVPYKDLVTSASPRRTVGE
ncbi:helix-turn-helix transcriptional regulator [Brevibacillus sp. MER 51]|uniref:helix-turn-helix domain-containing protein n=1 Tax=Brevibacillus sp. MER 51 TaxID=2939560 RepID=UPI00333F2E56